MVKTFMKGVRLRKCLSINDRKLIAMLLLYGGLNHSKFLCLVFRGRGAWLGAKERAVATFAECFLIDAFSIIETFSTR